MTLNPSNISNSGMTTQLAEHWLMYRHKSRLPLASQSPGASQTGVSKLSFALSWAWDFSDPRFYKVHRLLQEAKLSDSNLLSVSSEVHVGRAGDRNVGVRYTDALGALPRVASCEYVAWASSPARVSP